MKRFLTYLNNGLFLCFGLLAFDSSALTFKTDGSVVQASGKVTQTSYAKRFGTVLSGENVQWQFSKETDTPNGYFGGDLFIIGTPLLRLSKIPEGSNYITELTKQNGFSSEDALQKYVVAAANSDFLEALDLSQDDAIAYVGNVSDEQIAQMDDSVGNEFSEMQSSVKDALQENLKDLIDEKIKESVSESLSDYLDTYHEDMLADGWSYDGVVDGFDQYSKCISGCDLL